MNTLVINLTRFGDLLQTQPVLSGLRERGETTGLICLDNFASAARLLRDLDHVHPLPGARLMAELDTDWRDAVRDVDQWTAELGRTFPPDRAVNLTPSLSARILTGRFHAHEPAGFLLDEYGFGINASPWASFLQLASGKRGLSPFNVADLFRRAAGLDQACSFRLRDPLPEIREKGLRLIRENMSGTAPEKGFVAFQLGASEERRRWPMDAFVRLGEILSAEGYAPVLLGTAAEAHLGEQFAVHGPPCSDLMGKTSLEKLAGVLTECRLLVTNDTGTMHLAAGLGTPTAAVFLATAQPWDTGPYKAGCLCFEPDLDCHPCAFGTACSREEECRRTVRAETAGHSVLHFLEKGEWPEISPDEGARAWLTVKDKHGFMTLRSLSGHENMDRTRWMEIQHHFYRRFLDGESPSAPPRPHGLSHETATSVAKTLTDATELLTLVEQQANLLALRPMEKLKAKFLAFCQRLTSCLESDSRLATLGALWTFESRQHGTDMASFAALARRYADLIQALGAHLD